MKRSILFIALASCMLIGASGASAGVIETDVSVVKEEIKAEAVSIDFANSTFATVKYDGIEYDYTVSGVNQAFICKNEDFAYVHSVSEMPDLLVRHRFYHACKSQEVVLNKVYPNAGNEDAYRRARDGLSKA